MVHLKNRFPKPGKFALIIIWPLCLPSQATAQLLPDNSLAAESSVLIPGQTLGKIPITKIEGGARRGSSLFHSFRDFNIEAGQGAYFANPAGVTAILNRVTGSRPSEIFGTLGVLGNANLYLLNPNGIIFGPNAQLELNGSFLATTADSISLSDGTTFSATEPTTVPLLTNSVPVGLDFGSSPGKIEVRGSGHNVLRPGDPRLPSLSLVPAAGLEVKPGQTLALVGGEVAFIGGVATAPSGRLEIAGVAEGKVGILPLSSGGFSLNFEQAEQFQDLVFSRLSLLNASGTSPGTIQVWGDDITLTDSSLFLLQNLGALPQGDISIHAANALTVIGVTESVPIFSDLLRFDSGVRSQSLGSGRGADVNITARTLTLERGGRIHLENFASGSSGHLKIEASESLRLMGELPFDPLFPVGSFISISNIGTGAAGRMEIVTRQLSVRDGSLITSTLFGTGAGGDIKLRATDSIEVSGFNSNSLIPSIISSSNQGGGRGGNLTIETERLSVLDGGRVDASTLAAGTAGNLTIRARDWVEVRGTIPGSLNPSLITASANQVDPEIQKILGLPPLPTGASGNLAIQTRELRVSDGARLSVNHDGFSNAGSLTIEAKAIFLDSRGGITAVTRSGQGGNIALRATDIRLSDGSQISATAGGSGDGGNVAINAERLLLLSGSESAANAFEGQGGRIDIAAEVLLVSPDSRISASSQFGLDGQVNLNVSNFQTNPADRGLPASVSISEDLLVQTCAAARQKSRFTIEGRQGMPASPDSRASAYTLTDLAPLGEVVGADKLADGRVRLLSCDRLPSEAGAEKE